MFRIRVLPFILAISLIAMSLFACTQKNELSKTLTPITIQLAWTHQSQFVGMYAADQMGFYADEGLAVTFVEGGVDVDKFQPVLDGTIQFGMGSADELILARSEGKPLQAISTIFRRNPVVFISLAEKNITRPQDFVGKTIRVVAPIAPTLHAMMAHIGINQSQYSTVEISSDIENFASGNVPVWGAFITSIVVEIQKEGYEINIVYPDDYGVHFYADSIFTTDDLIKNDPDLVTRFLRATLKGWTYAVENSTEVPALVQKYNPQADPAIEEAKMITILPLVNTGEDFIGWMKPDIWAGMEQTLRTQEVLTKPVDITQVYTLKFLEEIHK